MNLRQVTTILCINLDVKFVIQAASTSRGTDLGTAATLVASLPSTTCHPTHSLPDSSELPCLGTSRVLLRSGPPGTGLCQPQLRPPQAPLVHPRHPGSCSEEVQLSPQSGLVNERGERETWSS